MSGRIVDSRLEVTFHAAPGESNEMAILPHVSGVRIVDIRQAGRGRDQIAGRRGRDELVAGPDNDLIRASDEDRDVVRCGRGRDRLFVSRNDRWRRCESVTFGPPD